MPISFLTITQKGVFSNIMDNKISFPENMIYQSNKKKFQNQFSSNNIIFNLSTILNTWYPTYDIYIYIYIYIAVKRGKKGKKKSRVKREYLLFCQEEKENKRKQSVGFSLIDKISCDQTRDLRLILFNLMMNERLVFSSKKKKIWGSNPVYIKN